MAIYSEMFHYEWRFSIAMLNYQGVNGWIFQHAVSKAIPPSLPSTRLTQIWTITILFMGKLLFLMVTLQLQTASNCQKVH